VIRAELGLLAVLGDSPTSDSGFRPIAERDRRSTVALRLSLVTRGKFLAKDRGIYPSPTYRANPFVEDAEGRY
jgi:hypothetical protein